MPFAVTATIGIPGFARHVPDGTAGLKPTPNGQSPSNPAGRSDDLAAPLAQERPQNIANVGVIVRNQRDVADPRVVGSPVGRHNHASG